MPSLCRARVLPGEGAARGAGHLRWRGGRPAGIGPLAGPRGDGGGKAASHARVIDRLAAVGVCGQQRVAGLDEDIVPVGGHRVEVVSGGAVPGGEERQAAGGALAAALALRGPLIDIELAVVVGGEERIGALEEGRLAIGGEVGGVGQGGERRQGDEEQRKGAL